ncbi:MAG: alkaline phosphatase D family protein [Acidobacteriaceae bacterium]
MDRRLFLKSTSATGTLAWLAPQLLAAQSGATAPVSNSYQSSAPFLLDAALTGLSQADRDILFRVDSSVKPAQQAATYPQSVASGDPRSDGIVLWTRVEPVLQASPSNDMLAWQISSSSAFEPANILIEGVTLLTRDRDSVAKFSVAHPVLHPFTNYYFRFLYNQVPSRTGRFKTLPLATAALAQLKLGYVVCQDYGNGFYNALTYLAQEDVDYVVHLGDYIYETISSANFQNQPVRPVPPFATGGPIPQNVDDYRHLYKVYRSDPHQQAVHERFAYIQLWDDHEFANDCHQDLHPDNNTAPTTAATPQPNLRQAANQAWSEFGLADTPFNPGLDWEHSIQLYRTFSFGSLAELIVTDERLYRDGPPCGSNLIGQRYFSLGCGAMHDASRTMLGLTQRQWFLNQLTASQSTWKLWANEVMLMQLKLALLYIDLDQWDGYQQERNLILNTVKHGHIKNFVALTGDLHTFLAGYLKTDFDNPFESPVGVELMVGSITSANFTEEINAALPLPSSPVPAKHMGVPPDLVEDIITAANPWIKFWDSTTHGYAILTLTPAQLICQFKAVSTITQPTSALRVLRTLTVPVNKVELHQS